MILSCSTITYGGLASVPDFEKVIASVKSVGYPDVGIEYPMLPEKLKKVPGLGGETARKAGLTVSAVAIDTSLAMADVVRGFGSKVGWLCLFEKDIDLAIEKTKALTAVCTRAGVDVSLHPHIRSNITNTEELDRVIMACEPNRTSVTVDTAHLTGLDVDIPEFINRYKRTISLVHLKDLRARKPQDKIDYSTDFVDLGEGVADLKGTIKALLAVGYSGPVMVEVDFPQESSVEASVKKNYVFLASLLGQGA
jgi:Xylose isomerase-like TIM barrel